MTTSQINLRMQFNEVEDEDTDHNVSAQEQGADVPMIRLHTVGVYESYMYPRNAFIEHLRAHFKMHPLYNKIARQVPSGYWFICDNVDILSEEYTVFAISRITDDKMCSMHCYTDEQYTHFMDPGLRIDLPYYAPPEFFADVKQFIEINVQEIPLEARVHQTPMLRIAIPED